MDREPEGVSARSLLGAFLAVVVLCAVFFSLGFFLGYRQGHPANTLTTEQVPAGSDVPAEVNPAEASPAGANPEPGIPGGVSPPAAAALPAESETAPDRSNTPATAALSAASAAGEPKRGPAAAEDESSDAAIPLRVPPGTLVQVAAVTNRQDADNFVRVLKSKSYPALILTPAQARAKDNFYRVVAGPYKSRTDAERVRKELMAEGFKPFIR